MMMYFKMYYAAHVHDLSWKHPRPFFPPVPVVLLKYKYQFCFNEMAMLIHHIIVMLKEFRIRSVDVRARRGSHQPEPTREADQ